MTALKQLALPEPVYTTWNLPGLESTTGKAAKISFY